MGASTYTSIPESIGAIGHNNLFVEEIKTYLELHIDMIDLQEIACTELAFEPPLKLHAGHTRDQILAVFRLFNTELLFIKKIEIRRGLLASHDVRRLRY